MMYIVTQTRESERMNRIGFALFLAAAMMAIPIFAGIASADNNSSGTITPVVEQGTTDRLGGGDWIAVRIGDTNFGVVYGTAKNLNKIYILADYKRYIAGVDFYDAQGNFVKTRGVPVWTVFVQSFDRMIEFKDQSDNHRFDMRIWDHGNESEDMPIKGLTLIQAWTMSGLTQETVNGVLFVNFTLGIPNKDYTWAWSEMMRRPVVAPRALGSVEQVAFTFHIRVGIEDTTARVPWFTVKIAGEDERRVLNKSFDGWREIEGQKVNMSMKYDHLIQGWDFAGNESSLLMETHMIFGHVVSKELAERYRLGERNRICERNCEGNSTELGDDEKQIPEDPKEVSVRDHHGAIDFADDWERIGRFTWVSDVVVDGEQKDLHFQVHGGGPWSFTYDRATFFGVHMLGAFVYPAGQSIFHDPGFDAAAYQISIPGVTNLAPMTVLLLQLIVVVVAVVLAVILKARRKGQK